MLIPSSEWATPTTTLYEPSGDFNRSNGPHAMAMPAGRRRRHEHQSPAEVEFMPREDRQLQCLLVFHCLLVCPTNDSDVGLDVGKHPDRRA